MSRLGRSNINDHVEMDGSGKYIPVLIRFQVRYELPTLFVSTAATCAISYIEYNQMKFKYHL